MKGKFNWIIIDVEITYIDLNLNSYNGNALFTFATTNPEVQAMTAHVHKILTNQSLLLFCTERLMEGNGTMSIFKAPTNRQSYKHTEADQAYRKQIKF